jgi:tetratricopeptide (TPR) repeat protein
MKIVLKNIILFSLVLFPLHLFGQARLSSEEAEKRVIEKINPVYSPLAKQARIQGIVKMEILVSEKGEASFKRILSGHPLLVQSAIDAARNGKYSPLIVEGKTVPFITTVEIPFSLGIPQPDYDREQKIADQYFKKENDCRTLLNGGKSKDAEPVCKAAVPLADQLADNRKLEKMGAYEEVGISLLGQSRFQEALQYFNKAFEFAQSCLKDKDAEMAYAYRHLGMANHGLGNYETAIDYYRKSERSLKLARENIGMEELKEKYLKALKQVLSYHVLAAKTIGANDEAEKTQKELRDLS